jgi:116 kDa U5 small nuclear ribonucleoprotein component
VRQVLGEESADLSVTLRELGVHVRKEDLYLDPKPLLRLVMTRFFGTSTGLVDVVVEHIPSPVQVGWPPAELPWGEGIGVLRYRAVCS